MSLQPFFESVETLAFSAAIRESAWMAAMVNILHILALVVFVGAILIVDLRLLRTGLTRQPVSRGARDAQPWLIGALIGMVLTGVPQAMSTSIKQYYSPYFWLKMEVLAVALIFTFTLRRWVTLAPEDRVGPFWSGVVGLTSIALWTVVPVCGRLIGLMG
jgi:hypothetical protein